MTDNPDWQTGTNIEAQDLNELAVSIVAQTINELAVDIAAQSLGTLSTDISSQSISELDMDITAQTVGDLTTNITAQGIGVETGTEFAASQGDFKSPLVSNLSVPTGSTTSDVMYTNSTGNLEIVEQVAIWPDDAVADPYIGIWGIDLDGDGTPNARLGGPGDGQPISFDPGVRLPDGGTISVSVYHEEGSSVTFDGGVLIRTNA